VEALNLAQLTKEMVVAHLRSIADPTRVAAEDVRGTLIARLKGRRLSGYDIQEAVAEVCKGAVMGLVLMKCNVARGAARILLAAEAAARTAGLDHEAVSIAAIKGISDSRRFVSAPEVDEIRRHIEAARLGSGQTFNHFCKDLCPHQSHPDYVPPRL
jgi:hypothetical protein